MSQIVLKIVKVFIGSPGGLESERQAAKRIIDEINQSHSEHWGCQIKLIGWEATLPGYSRAQSLINQDLDKCDYFIGVIWNHWGSKPDDGDSRYTSGFHEEFERAKGRYEKKLIRDIALFFKDIPEVQLKDMGPSVKKVVAFRQECIERRKPLFKEFKDLDGFEALFRQQIEAIGWLEAQFPSSPSNDVTDPTQPAKSDGHKSDLADASRSLIAATSATFVTELLQRSSDWDAISPFEVARLRLIASSITRSGNDDQRVGNHDANLLFVKRNEFGFSDQEMRALLDAGVAGSDDQNVPLWHWVSAPPDASTGVKRIEVLSVFGNSQEKPNAIRVLQKMGRGTPALDDFIDREKTIRSWVGGHSEGFDAALDFLKTNGCARDLIVIEQLLDEAPENQRNALAVTVIAMRASLDLSDAFKGLTEFDPDPIAEHVVDQLFSHPESVPTETLESLLTLKSDTVRRRAAKHLQARLAIDAPAAERLMTDSDPAVRLVAVETLTRHGQTLDEATIKKALVRPRPRGLLAFGLHDNEDYHEVFLASQLSSLTYKELIQKVDATGIYDHIEIAILDRQFTGRRLEAIRSNLNDGFKNHFEVRYQRLASLPSVSEKFLRDAKNLEKFLCRRLTTTALDALCAYGDRADLSLIRKTLERYETGFSEVALRYLARFGNWSDRERILSFTDRTQFDGSVFQAPRGNRGLPVAASLYAIGKSRLADLLRLDFSYAVRRALIAAMSQRDITKLSDDIIITGLNSEDDQSRKVLALKCTQALGQTRVRRLLDKYIAQDGQRYYNSIHWLDLGASMSRGIVKKVVTFELTESM